MHSELWNLSLFALAMGKAAGLTLLGPGILFVYAAEKWASANRVPARNQGERWLAKMKLSDAMMLGSTVVKPTKGFLLKEWYDGLRGCALGMACYAANVEVRHQDKLEEIHRAWTWTKSVVAMPVNLCACRELRWRSASYAQIIAHLFDFHIVAIDRLEPVLTIECLVDWIRSVEPEDAARCRVIGRKARRVSEEQTVGG
jgi:hypothetical protein